VWYVRRKQCLKTAGRCVKMRKGRKFEIIACVVSRIDDRLG
jgi:hypothetical protein